MIPASYLFKNLYHETWETADVPAMKESHPRFPTGLMRPLTMAITALLSRSNGTHRFGGHAYE